MELKRCTWQDPNAKRCEEIATHEQTAQDGEVWAHLCDEHHAMLDGTVGVDVNKMLAYWVRAQGGSRAAANRMTGVTR
jgi:hypothetical protein